MTNIPGNLVTALQARRVIPFAGAGVSMNVRRQQSAPSDPPAFPSWQQLLQKAVDLLESENQADAAHDARSFLAMKRQEPEYVTKVASIVRGALPGAVWAQFLRAHFDIHRSGVDDRSLMLARSLWQLGSPLILTTNYDHVLKWASDDDVDEWGVAQPAELAHLLSGHLVRRAVWHLHGCISKAEDIVLTTESYEALYHSDAQRSNLQSALTSLRSLLSTHTLVFVGFGFSDHALASQFEWLQSTFGGFGTVHYALVHHDYVARIEAVLRQRAIQVIAYRDHGQPLIELVEQLAQVTNSPRKQRPRAIPASSSSATAREPTGPISTVLCGCGWWARNRTVLPLIAQSPRRLKVVAITTLLDAAEFEDIVENLDELNYKRPLPQTLPRRLFDDLVASDKEVLAGCYHVTDTSLMLRRDVWRRKTRQAWDALYKCRDDAVPLKLQRPVSAYDLEGLPNELLSTIKACVINTPNKLHTDIAETAMFKGLHVYAERPINPHDAPLEDLVRQAREHGVRLFNGVQRRLEDTFRYIFNAVWHRVSFNKLREIRIVLASGRKLHGWRTNYELAGGGIAMDEGYHLLDAAAWIAFADNHDLRLNRRAIQGWVHVDSDRACADGTSGDLPPNIETAVKGVLRLPGDVVLSFDLSYHAPEGSVYELFEVRDCDGNVIRLVRDQPQRSQKPGVLLHQKADGTVVSHVLAEGAKGQSEVFKLPGEIEVAMGGISLAGGANNTGPLEQFIDAINRGTGAEVLFEPPVDFASRFVGNDVRGYECDALFSINTDHLIKTIYHLAHHPAKPPHKA